MVVNNRSYILEVGEKTEELIFTMGTNPLILNCAQGLCVQWLLNQMGRGDFPYDKKNKVCDHVHPHAITFQGIYDDHDSSKRRFKERVGVKKTVLVKDAEGIERYRAYERDYNIIRAAGLHFMSVGISMPISVESLTTQLKCSQRSCFYIGIEERKKPSHAIAVVVDRSINNIEEYNFFDVNYGYFLLRTQERFEEWLNFFLQKSCYKMSAGYSSAYVCSLGAWW